MVIDSDRARLQRLQTLHNFIQDVGADAGDRYNRVDVFLSWREVEFDGSRRDDFGDGERTSPIVVQLLHGAVRGVVLETQPSFVSNLVLWHCLMVPVIILLHVIHCPFEHSLHLLLGTTLRKVNMCKYPPIGSIIILPDDVYKSSKIMLPKEGLCL